MLMTLLTPAAGVLMGAEWLPLSLEGLLGSMFASPLVGGVLFVGLALGFSGRRYWGVCAFFGLGALSLALMLVDALVGLSAPLGWAHRAHTDYVGFVYMGWVAWLACLVMAWPLMRALRLHYWQPWTRPEQWEVGDERNARWTYRAAGRSPSPKPRS